jgi:CheY-like chemotaxis protein
MPSGQNSIATLKPNPQLKIKPPDISILIIEDDPDFLELVGGQMAHISGARVISAHNCDEAVSILAQKAFDLIVCDWALASRTAPEVFRIVDPLLSGGENQHLHKKIPIIFMSGSEKIGPTQNMRQLKNFEAVSFILKNLGPSMIRVMAENILDCFNPDAEPEICTYHS